MTDKPQTQGGTVKRKKRKATGWEKIHKIYLSKDFYPRYKELLKLNNNNELMKNWTKDLNRQMANKYMKRCSKSHVIRPLLIKIQTT